ncbi:MAG: glycosyltransferase family 2 protein [Caldilineaceae bacterium]
MTKPPAPPDLSIIILSWNVWPLLSACLRSLETMTRAVPAQGPQVRLFGPDDQAHTVEVIVVDNASADATPQQLPVDFPWVRFMQSGANLGFTKGNNLGYQASRGTTVFFLNPDTTLVDPTVSAGTDPCTNGLWVLYQTLLNDPALGLVGPRLQYGDGEWQNSRRHFPERLTGFWESTWLGRAWPNNRWARHYQMADWPAAFAHDVDWLTGAAMFARRAALESIRTQNSPGPFDEHFFMYSEELDLCRRLRLQGWRIRYEPATTITHYEGRSSEQVVAARHIRFNTSKVRYYQKYFGQGWAEALRIYLLLEYCLQILLEGGKLLLRQRPELRRQRIATYRQVLADGLRAT